MGWASACHDVRRLEACHAESYLTSGNANADVDGPAGPTIANSETSAADDPVDGDSAVACAGVEGTHRARNGGESAVEQMDSDPLAPDDSDDDYEEHKDTRSENEKELVVDNDHDNQEDFERLQNMISELPNTFDESFKRSANRIQEDSDRRHDLMANAVSRPESLNDFLLHQLAEMDIDDRVEQIAERIISTLDARDGGYLRTPLADLLPAGHSEEDLKLAETALGSRPVAGTNRHRRPQI